MGEGADAGTVPDAVPGVDLYEVVVLVERELDASDAETLRVLHEGVTEQVRYHVLLPVDDPARGVEGAMGALAAGEGVMTPAVAAPTVDEGVPRDELLEDCRARTRASVAALEATGARATGTAVCREPICALVDTVAEVEPREVVVMTRPHVVRELLHLDWTSRAERRLQVPVLHLVEHGGS